MPGAHPEALAWRVVMKLQSGQSITQISDRETGLAVSFNYVNNVWRRFRETGSVATHQGHRSAPPANTTLSYKEDIAIVHLIIDSPRATMHEQRAAFILETGAEIAYSTFCRAVRRLGYSRVKVRARPGAQPAAPPGPAARLRRPRAAR